MISEEELHDNKQQFDKSGRVPRSPSSAPTLSSVLLHFRLLSELVCVPEGGVCVKFCKLFQSRTCIREV